MSDHFFLWALNVLLQVTCVGAIGLAVAALIRKAGDSKILGVVFGADADDGRSDHLCGDAWDGAEHDFGRGRRCV